MRHGLQASKQPIRTLQAGSQWQQTTHELYQVGSQYCAGGQASVFEDILYMKTAKIKAGEVIINTL
jgi:hypothetical protein